MPIFVKDRYPGTAGESSGSGNNGGFSSNNIHSKRLPLASTYQEWIYEYIHGSTAYQYRLDPCYRDSELLPEPVALLRVPVSTAPGSAAEASQSGSISRFGRWKLTVYII